MSGRDQWDVGHVGGLEEHGGWTEEREARTRGHTEGSNAKSTRGCMSWGQEQGGHGGQRQGGKGNAEGVDAGEIKGMDAGGTQRIG